AYSGVGKHDVDAAECLKRRVHHCLLIRPTRDVATNWKSALATAKVSGEFFELLRRSRRQHEAIIQVCRVSCSGLTDAAGCACDQENRITHRRKYMLYGRGRKHAIHWRP